jgi:ubiquinone biosynthesis protein
MFGMRLRPELVLLQKTMVQVEGVARALDPKHDMWAAARPIVERWVARELGVEGVARRGAEEVRDAWMAVRRLPKALATFETAARAIGEGASPAQQNRFQWMSFWVGFAVGAVLLVMLSGCPTRAKTVPLPTPKYTATAPAPRVEVIPVAPSAPAAETPAPAPAITPPALATP